MRKTECRGWVTDFIQLMTDANWFAVTNSIPQLGEDKKAHCELRLVLSNKSEAVGRTARLETNRSGR
jgi:hypothetical protein